MAPTASAATSLLMVLLPLTGTSPSVTREPRAFSHRSRHVNGPRRPNRKAAQQRGRITPLTAPSDDKRQSRFAWTAQLRAEILRDDDAGECRVRKGPLRSRLGDGQGSIARGAARADRPNL